MPILDDPRHERFVQALAEGVPQGKAYLDAGFQASNPESLKANASRLRARPEVRERLHDILLGGARLAEITSADVMRMLLQDHDMATEKKHFGAAIRALELIGRQIGMFVDRREVRVSPLDDLS